MAVRILGVGVDLVEVARLERTARRRPEVLDRLFGSAERRAAEAMSPGRSAEGLALFFGLKEAALKAIGTGWGQGVGWKDVRIAVDERGRLRVVPFRTARSRMRGLGGRRLVAEAGVGGGIVLAAVLVLGEGTAPRARAR